MFERFRKLGIFSKSIIAASTLLVLATVGLTAVLMYSQRYISQTTIQQPRSEPYSAPKNSISGKPTRITIPSLKIDLPVIDGRYDPETHGWTLTSDSAQFFVDSAEPNNIGGKTFIYGHYRKGVFSELHNIRPNSLLSLTTAQGYKFTYRFSSSFTTSPSDLSVLNNTEDPVLYVQTCSGIFFQHRQIFSFKYVGYSEESARAS